MNPARVAPGQPALNALRRSPRSERQLRRPVRESIDGLSRAFREQLDWLYFVNGIDPGVGAAEYRSTRVVASGGTTATGAT